jgi:hypothetical protein
MSFNQFRRVVSIPNGNPLTWHGNTEGLNGVGLMEPGELGGVLPFNSHQFQLVKMDSGATSATATGIPAAGQLAFWKDRANYLVTNDVRFADSALVPAGQFPRDGRDSVAGVIEMAVVAGEQFFVHQKGASTGVKVSTSPNPGDVFVPNSGTNADCTTTAAGTAPAGLPVGVVTSSTKTGSLVPGYLFVEFID